MKALLPFHFHFYRINVKRLKWWTVFLSLWVAFYFVTFILILKSENFYICHLSCLLNLKSENFYICHLSCLLNINYKSHRTSPWTKILCYLKLCFFPLCLRKIDEVIKCWKPDKLLEDSNICKKLKLLLFLISSHTVFPPIFDPFAYLSYIDKFWISSQSATFMKC